MHTCLGMSIQEIPENVKKFSRIKISAPNMWLLQNISMFGKRGVCRNMGEANMVILLQED